VAIVHHGPGHVVGRKHVGHVLDPHERIDQDAADMVVFDREESRQRIGAHARAPHHSGRENLLT